MDDILKSLNLSYIELVEDICVHIIDKDGKTVYYSKGCEKIEGYKKEDVVGKHMTEVYLSENKNKFDEESSMQLKVLKTKQPAKNVPMTYYAADNKLVQVVSSTYPIIKDGVFVGAMCLFKDTTDLINMKSVIEDMKSMIHRENTIKLKNGTSYTFNSIIGKNKNLLDTIEISKKLAKGTSPIMIIGETGSGKELYAQSIHNYSDYSKGPFVALNCSAIPETLIEGLLFGTTKGAFTGATDMKGLFEEAQNGTLFLDEINSMNLMLQAKLLRVLEDKKVRRLGGNSEIEINCRILSATNISASELLNVKFFRNDLYYRLAAATVEIPPLRERTTDIEVLVDHFIKENNRIMKRDIQKISDTCLNVLKKYSWPGNVRQLKHAIDYAFNLIKYDDTVLDLNHLPQYIFNSVKMSEIDNVHIKCEHNDLKAIINDVERKLITQSIKDSNGNLSQTAKSLGISRQNLHYRMKILKVDVD